MIKRLCSNIIEEDIPRYIKDCDYIDFQTLPDKELIEYVRNYYEKHFPVDVTAWIRVNEVDSNLIFGQSLYKQVCYVRDVLSSIVFDGQGYEEYILNVTVIATHMAKSVKLPVFRIYNPNLKIEFILRYNFYNWKVSVLSKVPIEVDLDGIIEKEENNIQPMYCQGFPEIKVFGMYKDDNKKFTVSIKDDYKLYAFMFLVIRYLKSRLNDDAFSRGGNQNGKRITNHPLSKVPSM